MKLDWGGHIEDREFYVTHLVGGEDIILGEPALTANNTIIKAGNFPVTIQPPDKEIITLEPWQGEVSTKMVSARTNITINPSSNLKGPTVIKTLHSLVQPVFDPFREFPEIFIDKPPTELPPLRNINHHINLKPGFSWKPTRIFSHDKFRSQMTDKLVAELKSGRIERETNPINSVLMFTTAKKDDTARYLLDCVPRNEWVIKDKTPLPNILQILEWVQQENYWTILDLADAYHSVRNDPHSVKHTTFVTHMGNFNSLVM